MPRTSGQQIDARKTWAPVLTFWLGFDHDDPAALKEQWRRWFLSGPLLDREIEARFSDLVRQAAAGRLATWSGSSEGRLALILLLDQFPRNVYRGSRGAFANDVEAQGLTQEGIELRSDRELPLLGRLFFYMPLQHAESPTLQEQSLRMYRGLAAEPAPQHVRAVLEDAVRYAEQHADIIARFGRFPHRNRALGRASTAAEMAYLESGGATFGQ